MNNNQLSENLLSESNTDGNTRQRKESQIDKEVMKITTQTDSQKYFTQHEKWKVKMSDDNDFIIDIPTNPSKDQITMKLKEYISIDVPINVIDEEYSQDKKSSMNVGGEITLYVSHEKKEISLQYKDKGYYEIACQYINYKQFNLYRHYIIKEPLSLPSNIQETLDLIPDVDPRIKKRMKQYGVKIRRLQSKITIENPNSCWWKFEFILTWFGPVMSVVTYYSDIWATILFFMNGFYWYGSMMILLWLIAMVSKSSLHSTDEDEDPKYTIKGHHILLGIDLLVYRAQESYDNFEAYPRKYHSDTSKYAHVRYYELGLKTVPKLSLFIYQFAYSSMILDEPVDLVKMIPAILTLINFVPALSAIRDTINIERTNSSITKFLVILFLYVQVSWKLIIFSTYAILHRPSAIWYILFVPSPLFCCLSCLLHMQTNSQGPFLALISMSLFGYILPMYPVLDPFSIFGFFAISDINDNWDQVDQGQNFSTIVNIGIYLFKIHQVFNAFCIVVLPVIACIERKLKATKQKQESGQEEKTQAESQSNTEKLQEIKDVEDSNTKLQIVDDVQSSNNL